mgnify:CR=1 FL=1
MPWIGRKKIAFVPVWRPNARPPDIVPPDWENDILRRVLYDPDATGRDRSLRAFIRTASSGLADLDAIVTERHSIDQQDVPPSALEAQLGPRLRAQGCDAAAIVMLGGPGAGTNAGFWSRFVMAEGVGVWAMELMHGLTGFRDLYPFGNDADPHNPVIGRYDEMSAAAATHPCAYTRLGCQWLDPNTVVRHTARVATYSLHAISLPQPPPTGRVAAVRIGNGVPYVMVEARLKADQFDAGIPEEGVIVYAVQTSSPLGYRENNLRPVVLKTDPSLLPGQAFTADGLSVRVTSAIPGGFEVVIADSNPPFRTGELLSYSDAGTPGNVAAPTVVGFGGWRQFRTVFAGSNLNGEHRIYAIDTQGRLFSYGDNGTPGNVANPVVVGYGGWQQFPFVFAGRTVAGEPRIYAVDGNGRLLSYVDNGAPGNVSNPVVVGFGGWQSFTRLFAGRNRAGEHRIYAVDGNGRLLSYIDNGTVGNVANPVVVGYGGWKNFKFLFGGRNAAGEDRIYAVDGSGQLLSYADAVTPGNVSNPTIVGFGGWLQFAFIFAGQDLAGRDRIYAVVG